MTFYINPWLKYYYFQFLKTNGHHNSTSGLDFDLFVVIYVSFYIDLPNFI